MNFIDTLKNKAKKKNKRIVLPESMDRRVLEAAIAATMEGIANIILLGNENEIKSNNRDLDFSGISFVNPKTSILNDYFVKSLYNLRKDKGVSLEDAKRLIDEDYMYFACMLVKENFADGVVSGACHSTANTLRPSLQIIKTKEDSDLVSAFFLMVVPNTDYGSNGVFIFADAGLNQNPTANELSSIAYSSAKTFELLVGEEAKIAMLSHSTKGSASHSDVAKMIEATNITRIRFPELKVDGELQLDAAIVPEAAQSKAPNSEVAGYANVLIFPDLDAGNIGYKLVERLAKAEAYGPITQGIRKPINDLSRGCSINDIVGVIAITVIQCED